MSHGVRSPFWFAFGSPFGSPFLRLMSNGVSSPLLVPPFGPPFGPLLANRAKAWRFWNSFCDWCQCQAVDAAVAFDVGAAPRADLCDVRKQVVVKSISDDEYASIVRAYKMSRDEMKSDDRETALVLRDLIWGRKGN